MLEEMKKKMKGKEEENSMAERSTISLSIHSLDNQPLQILISPGPLLSLLLHYYPLKNSNILRYVINLDPHFSHTRIPSDLTYREQ